MVKLYFYSLYSSISTTLPIYACCSKNIIGWDGLAGDNHYTYHTLDSKIKNALLSNLGGVFYDENCKYTRSAKLYSIDIGKFYEDFEQLQADILIKQLSGI